MDQIPERPLGDQPLGDPVEFTGAGTPNRTQEHHGRYATLRPIRPDEDAAQLYAASHPPAGDPTVWTYLYDGPYPDVPSYATALGEQAQSPDSRVFAITRPDEDDKPLGVVSYLAIVPEHGTIEVGNIWFGPELKRTRAATEAIFLLATHAFDDLKYRRLEWKCNALNERSRDAATRFGFRYEGLFKHHRVVKHRNRDTAWFAITDDRWPALKAAFEAWLSPENFDPNGAQRKKLRDLTRQAGA